MLLQIQKDAAKKEYENLRYQQPYQRAIYSWTHLLELNRWHTDEYQAIIGDLSAEDLQVRSLPWLRMMNPNKLPSLAMQSIPDVDQAQKCA